MNITLYPQDFTQGAITINGNIASLKQIRTPEYILLDDTWNFQDLTIAVTFKSEINKTPKIEFYGGGGEYGQLYDSEGYAIIDADGARIYVKE